MIQKRIKIATITIDTDVWGFGVLAAYNTYCYDHSHCVQIFLLCVRIAIYFGRKKK